MMKDDNDSHFRNILKQTVIKRYSSNNFEQKYHDRIESNNRNDMAKSCKRELPNLIEFVIHGETNFLKQPKSNKTYIIINQIFLFA
jgi:hypothetical protein